tara:strand:+ start:3929 stop:6427 length:2499 start_codon:yes stop_codon:yes gene_type:complete
MAERKTGLPVDPTSPPIAQIISPFVPMSYQVDRPYSLNTQEVDGGLIYSETPQKVSDPQFAVPPVITGGIEFFKQFLDDPTETAGGIATAIGEEIKAYPERQVRTALAGGETINPETGEIERYDPLGVPATMALGSAASIARTAGDGGTVLGIMAGRNAKDGGKKLDQFLAARDRGLDDRDNYAETQGYIEPSDGAFRFEIDTSNARLKEGLFEDGILAGQDERYQRLNISEFRRKEGRVPKLDEVFDFEELFEQYPELRSIDVDKVPFMSSAGGTKAAFDPVNNIIYLGSAPSKEMIANILHEVQHAVQHIEGFTPGSSIARYLPEGFSKKLADIDMDISTSSEVLLASKKGVLNKKSFQERADEAVGRTIYKYNLGKKARNFFAGETDAYGYVDFSKFATPDELKELRKIAEKQLESDKRTSDVLKAGRMYRRQPGEVEARTVATKFRKGQQGVFPLDVQDTDPIDYFYLIDKTMLNKPTAPRVMESALSPNLLGESVGGQALIPTMPNRFFFEDLDMSELTLRPSLYPSGDLKGEEIPNSVDIELIRAGKKGKGHGTEIMRRLTKMADETGTTMTLFPTPYGDGGLNLEDLVSFYKKQGFEYLDPDPNNLDIDREMIRYPRVAKKKEGGTGLLGGDKPQRFYHGAKTGYKEFDPDAEVTFVADTPSTAEYYTDFTDVYGRFPTPAEGANIRPVYLKDVNFFDVDNPEHIKQLRESDWYKSKKAELDDGFTYPEEGDFVDVVEAGNYDVIEDSGLIDWIKSQGFDGFTTYEQDGKNYGVFNVENIVPGVAKKAEGGVVSLLDMAQNMNRGPKGVASLSSIARNMNRPMVS